MCTTSKEILRKVIASFVIVALVVSMCPSAAFASSEEAPALATGEVLADEESAASEPIAITAPQENADVQAMPSQGDKDQGQDIPESTDGDSTNSDVGGTYDEPVDVAPQEEVPEEAPAEEQTDTVVAPQSEDEVTTVGLDDVSGQDLALSTMSVEGNATGKCYYFDKTDESDNSTAKVKVYGVTSGEVTYDAATKTLTLKNAQVNGEIEAAGDLRIVLVGNNTVKGWDYFYENYNYNSETGQDEYQTDYANGYDRDNKSFEVAGKITFSGAGSLNVSESIACTQLTISGGTINTNDNYGLFDDCKSLVVTGGTVKGDVRCSKLEMRGGTITGGVHNEIDQSVNVTMSSGTIGGYINAANGSVVVSGGTVKGKVWCGKLEMRGGAITGGVGEEYRYQSINVTMSGGTVSGGIYCTTLAMTGGTVTGDIGDYHSQNFTVSGGTINGKVSCTTLELSKSGKISYVGGGVNDGSSGVSCTTLRMSGGTIGVSRCKYGIGCKYATITGGTVSITNCDSGISAHETENAKIATVNVLGGKVAIANAAHYGIYVSRGNFTMRGGSVAITKSYEDAIGVYGTDYRGKHYGGKVTITGGKLTATVRKPTNRYAISADSVSNKTACLKQIVGCLSTGACFASGGITYRISEYFGVNVYRYNSKKKTAKFNKAKYGKCTYNVTGIAAKAFATKQGRKLTSITFVNSIYAIGAQAFKGTKALRSLTFKQGFYGVYTTYKSYTNYGGGKYKITGGKLVVQKGYSIRCAKKAFSGMGAGGGKRLTLVMNRDPQVSQLYRNWLVKHGMPKQAKVTGKVS